jgi:mono/diheme cytochrome c family protein
VIKAPAIGVLVALLAVPVSPASATGNSESGRLLAQHWCSGCHALPSAHAASDVAPTFEKVARDHKGDPSWVRAWLMSPHPPMEGINLTRQQIEDVTAYLQSLPSN